MAEPPDFRRGQGYLNVVPPPDSFSLRQAHIKPAHLIPPRQWIYGNWLCRGYVTLLIAAGGVGKTSLALGTCLAIATKRPLFGIPIHEQCNTALLQLEDPEDEIDRRLSALGEFYNINDDDLGGRFSLSQPDQKVLIAAPSEDGYDVAYPDQIAIIERVKAEKIGVLGVDPFAESHQLEENNNPQMVRAAAAWRRVAREGNCAVLLLHHIRKGIADSIEAARGAKALTDSARVGLLLTTMTEDEASGFNIEAEERHSYVRMDNAKANLAKRSGTSTWFHLCEVALNNGDEFHPDGDTVAVVERWTPASPWDGFSLDQCNACLDEIDAGLPNGDRYTKAKQSKERWAGNVLVQQFGRTPEGAQKIILDWLREGVLFEESANTAQKNKRKGLRVNHGSRPGTVVSP